MIGGLVARSAALAAIQLGKAVAGIFSSFSWIPFGVGIPMAIGAVAMMMSKYNSAKKDTGDLMSSPKGPVVALPPERGGGLYEGRADDTAILTTGPKGNKSQGNTESQKRMAVNQQKQTVAMEKMAEKQISKKDMEDGFIAALQTIGLTPTTIGESVGEAVVRTAS